MRMRTKGRRMNDEQIRMIEACETAQQWRDACDEIKASTPSKVCYPDDWFTKVVESGLMDRITARWGGSSNLSITTSNTLDEVKGFLRGDR